MFINTLDIGEYIEDGWTINREDSYYGECVAVFQEAIKTVSISPIIKEVSVDDYFRAVRSNLEVFSAVFYHGFIKENTLDVLSKYSGSVVKTIF